MAGASRPRSLPLSCDAIIAASPLPDALRLPLLPGLGRRGWALAKTTLGGWGPWLGPIQRVVNPLPRSQAIQSGP